ncbi:phenoloxidase-activating factor 2-like isoform X2 [Ornithodoros turicata]|uniref:phenoloxidase-activating factor 2-like isoform X2 n=1 Tax=Ornithodoros turicata TaxID=34597 RepID=UPI003138E4D1
MFGVRISEKMMCAARTFLQLFTLCCIIAACAAQPNATDGATGGTTGVRACKCMEYWDCVSSGGSPYAYCQYSTKVCCFVDPRARAVGILPKAPKIDNCGRKGVENRRDGVSQAGEWPWHVAILEKQNDIYVCGAALVDEYWVLTAAHCVDDYSDPRPLKLRLGEHDVQTQTEPFPYEERDVSHVVLHPAFDNTSLTHDIALVQVATPAKRRPNINTVCMPERGLTKLMLEDKAARCFITGWGKQREGGGHATVLKEIRVPLWKNKDCEFALRRHFGAQFKLSDSSLCAGEAGRDACDGDGGGPLVCERNTIWYQVGVVSFGVGCGRRDMPGVYSRVEDYRDWIHQVILNS